MTKTAAFIATPSNRARELFLGMHFGGSLPLSEKIEQDQDMSILGSRGQLTRHVS